MRRFVIGIAELLNAVFVILTPLGTFTNATQIHSLRPQDDAGAAICMCRMNQFELYHGIAIMLTESLFPPRVGWVD